MYLNRIKELLKELNMTQEELSHISEVPQPEISRIANGKKREIQLETAVKIARGLGRSVEYVFPDY
jgi:transcriptional regulator with XRE-family HTH domain